MSRARWWMVGLACGMACGIACGSEPAVEVRASPDAAGDAEAEDDAGEHEGDAAAQHGDALAQVDDAGMAVADAGHSEDAAALDAGDPDAGSALDGGVSTPDAGDWGPCSVNGVAGVCINVAACTAGQMATPGHCPGPRNIQCCTPRGTTFMCDPAQHPQPNAGLSESPGSGNCPPGMTPVAAFCIDTYEASLVEVLAGGGTAPWSPYHHPGTRRVRAVSLAGAVPQGYADGQTAGRACREAGKRLCSDAEWLRACRGPSNSVYPYGNTRMNGVCNDARGRHPAVELFPNDPNPFSRIQDACINQLPDSLDRSAGNLGCVTAEGVFDMMGNLHEWTADPAGTFRGGYYVDTVRNGAGCLYVTTAHNTLHWDYSTGFRCCADP